MSDADEELKNVAQLNENNARLRKAMTRLVDFIRRDQCDKDDDCACCKAYLNVAEHFASYAGLGTDSAKDGGR